MIPPALLEELTCILAAACLKLRTPMIPYGAGTSREGHITAIHGGITVNLSRMDRVIDVNGADLDCKVDAGVTGEALDSYLRNRPLLSD